MEERIGQTKIWGFNAGALTARVKFESGDEVCDFAEEVVQTIRNTEDASKPETAVRFRGYVLELEIVPAEDVGENEVELAERLEQRVSEMSF